MRMKKFFCLLVSAVFAMMLLSSCVTAAAATDGVVVATNGEELYMDIEWDYVIVYIDNIPNYRFWDYRMSRYWYRPVPYDRFRYIHRAPASHRFHNVPMHQHRDWGHQRPGYRPHHDVRPHTVRTTAECITDQVRTIVRMSDPISRKPEVIVQALE